MCSTPALAAICFLPVLAVVVKAPESADVYAVVGAFLVSITALIEARQKGRGTGDTIRVFIGTAAMGSMLPGLLFGLAMWQGWVSPELQGHLTWHFWAFAGFFCGLNGWGIIYKVNRVLNRRADAILRRYRENEQADGNDETKRIF